VDHEVVVELHQIKAGLVDEAPNLDGNGVAPGTGRFDPETHQGGTPAGGIKPGAGTILGRLKEHHLMIAAQGREHLPAVQVHQQFEHAAAVLATVDHVAQRDQAVTRLEIGQFQQFLQRGQATVDVAHHQSSHHPTPSNRALS